MENYVICTDTGSDLTAELYEKYNIIPLVMEYELDGKMYDDDYSPEGLKVFYDKMRAGASPKTTQINTAKYVEFFEQMLKECATIIYIGLSSGISGSYNNARMAAEEVNAKHEGAHVYTVDTLGASLMGGMLSIAASNNRKNGMSAEDNVKWLEQNKLRVNVYYTTPDLTYLHRGGRVSKTSAVMAHMLGINPILTVTTEGKLVSCDKVRGEKQTINKLIKNMQDTAIDPENTTLYISHSDCIERAQAAAERFKAEVGFKDVVITSIGTIIGAHTGPGLISTFWFGKERQ